MPTTTHRNILVGKLAKHGQEFLDIHSILVGLFAKCDRAVASEVLMEIGRARQPHPVAVVEGPISIKQEPVENLSSLLP